MGVRDSTRELLPDDDENESQETKPDGAEEPGSKKEEEPKMIKVKEYFVKYKNL